MSRIYPVIRAAVLIVLFTIKVYAVNPRNSVCVVKPELDEEIRESFIKLSEKYKDIGYNDVSEFFKEYSRGGHGSGFVYVDHRGENYVITNRHVVAMSGAVTLEIQKKDGGMEVYSGCTVVYVDDAADIAVIRFPEKAKAVSAGLPLYTKELADGKEVWSAGFPGLLGRPSWQITRGNVTNSRVSVPEIADTEASWFIQHSASIDPGNSGGPLLINSGNDNYAVAGINTWTMSNRQNTFFAIPSSIIGNVARVSERIAGMNIKDIDSALKNNCVEFTAAFNKALKSGRNEARFVSYAYSAKYGFDDLLDLRDSMSDEESLEMENKIMGGVPIEFLRVCSYEKMRRDFMRENAKDELSFVRVAEISGTGTAERTARTQFEFRKKKFTVEWKWENGHWRILDMDTSKVLRKVSSRHSSGDPGSSSSGEGRRSVFLGAGGGYYSWGGTKNDPLVYNADFGFIYDSGHGRYFKGITFEYCPSIIFNDDSGSGFFGECKFYSAGYTFGWSYLFGRTDSVLRPYLGIKFAITASIVNPAEPDDGSAESDFMISGAAKPVLGMEIKPGEARYGFIVESGVSGRLNNAGSAFAGGAFVNCFFRHEN